jgi:hypothetical protein
MSGVLKSIGKVFKKIVKVAKVVLPIALAVGAVVFTGGAALGLLPTFSGAIGGLVGGLGLSTGLAGALTGSIVSAGFGSALGGLKAAASGTSIIKGMQGGAVTGAVTGGLLGAVNPSTFGIVKGLDAAGNPITTTANALKNAGDAFASAGSKTVLSTGANGITSVAGTAGPSGGLLGGSGAASAVDAVAKSASGGYPAATSFAQMPMGASMVPAASSGGIGGFLGANPLLAGNIISGVASSLSGGNLSKDQIKQIKAEEASREAYSNFAYQGAYAGRENPFGTKPLAPPPGVQASNYYTPPNARWHYDPTTNTVVEARA